MVAETELYFSFHNDVPLKLPKLNVKKTKQKAIYMFTYACN